MNEAGFWRRVRDALNVGRPCQTVRKLSDAFTAGTPDALYCIRGVSGVLELKYTAAWPVRPTTEVSVGSGVTVEQRRWLEEWRAAGGRAHVLLGVAQDWFLLEIFEVPVSNKLSRLALQAVRVDNRAGTLKTLLQLSSTLMEQVEPADA